MHLAFSVECYAASGASFVSVPSTGASTTLKGRRFKTAQATCAIPFPCTCLCEFPCKKTFNQTNFLYRMLQPSSASDPRKTYSRQPSVQTEPTQMASLSRAESVTLRLRTSAFWNSSPNALMVKKQQSLETIAEKTAALFSTNPPNIKGGIDSGS